MFKKNKKSLIQKEAGFLIKQYYFSS